jgi:hypothetical protein
MGTYKIEGGGGGGWIPQNTHKNRKGVVYIFMVHSHLMLSPC